MTKGLKETFVGIFVVVGIIVFIALYTWLSGKVFFRNTYDASVYFQDVEGLRTGDPVFVYGIEKGKVKSMQIDQGQVQVVLAMDRSVRLPEDSEISIRSVSYVGADKYVKITPGISDKTSDVYYGTGGSLDMEALASQLDSLITTFGKIKIPDLDQAVRRISADLSKSLTRLLVMLEEPVDKIDMLTARLDSLTILFKGDGTVGRLLKSDELYNELRDTNLALKALIEDINANPKKYINIKVF